MSGVSFELQRLAKGGADPKAVLRRLAIAVDEVKWPDEMRQRINALRSLAGQMRTVANHAERESLNPLSYSDVWNARYGKLDWNLVRLPSERAPFPLFEAMRAYADGVAGQAKVFGTLLKKNIPKEKRHPQELLLLYVHQSTGDVKKHFTELAHLLTYSYEKFDITRNVSIGSLTRLFERHVTTRIARLNKTTP